MMEYGTMKTRLAEAYAATQNLQIQPTKHNIDLLTVILRNLDAVFTEIEKGEKAEKGEPDA